VNVREGGALGRFDRGGAGVECATVAGLGATDGRGGGVLRRPALTTRSSVLSGSVSGCGVSERGATEGSRNGALGGAVDVRVAALNSPLLDGGALLFAASPVLGGELGRRSAGTRAALLVPGVGGRGCDFSAMVWASRFVVASSDGAASSDSAVAVDEVAVGAVSQSATPPESSPSPQSESMSSVAGVNE